MLSVWLSYPHEVLNYGIFQTIFVFVTSHLKCDLVQNSVALSHLVYFIMCVDQHLHVDSMSEWHWTSQTSFHHLWNYMYSLTNSVENSWLQSYLLRVHYEIFDSISCELISHTLLRDMIKILKLVLNNQINFWVIMCIFVVKTFSNVNKKIIAMLSFQSSYQLYFFFRIFQNKITNIFFEWHHANPLL